MSVTITFGTFEWDKEKEELNVSQHKLDFYTAALAFIDMRRVIAVDERHSKLEPRFFCLGKIGKKIATVRFTERNKRIRIIGAGY
jgi:uncharacterized DUF497 family protein